MAGFPLEGISFDLFKFFQKKKKRSIMHWSACLQRKRVLFRLLSLSLLSADTQTPCFYTVGQLSSHDFFTSATAERWTSRSLRADASPQTLSLPASVQTPADLIRQELSQRVTAGTLTALQPGFGPMMASAVNCRTDLLHSIAAAMQNTATNAPSAQNQRCDPEELGRQHRAETSCSCEPTASTTTANQWTALWWNFGGRQETHH